MSKAIRAVADDDTKQVDVSYAMATYYRIEWPWIALHVFVIVGT